MESYLVRAIGSNRGRPRIYIDGAVLSRSQFQPGTAFEIDVQPERKTLILRRHDRGSRVVSRKRKPGRSEVIPVIDINSNAMLAALGSSTIVRIVIGAEAIIISPLASELARLDRLDRLRQSVQKGRLQIGSIAHGIGVLMGCCGCASIKFRFENKEIDRTRLEAVFAENRSDIACAQYVDSWIQAAEACDCPCHIDGDYSTMC